MKTTLSVNTAAGHRTPEISISIEGAPLSMDIESEIKEFAAYIKLTRSAYGNGTFRGTLTLDRIAGSLNSLLGCLQTQLHNEAASLLAAYPAESITMVKES